MFNTPYVKGLPAFQLFAGATPSSFSVLGFHCHPHIGVYGDDFTPCFPMVALSLPATMPLLNAALDVDAAADAFSLHIAPHLEEGALDASVDPLATTEFYFLLHALPQRSPCQKFVCDRNDEINLM